MSNKGITKKIGMLLIVFTALISLVLSSTSAGMIPDNISVDDLIKKYAHNDSWFTYNPSEEIGKPIGSAYDALKLEGARCLHPYDMVITGTKYQILNIFDINNETNGIKVYKVDKDGTKKEEEFSINDPKVKPLLMLAYLTKKADENPTNTEGYKGVIYRIFMVKTWIKQLQELGLSPLFETNLFDDSYLGGQETQKMLAEAGKYADNIINQTDTVKGKLIDITEDKDAVSVTTVNGKTFIGPYKLTLNGELDYIKVNGENVAGISTDLKTVQGIDKVVDGKEFYIVTDKNYDEITKIEVKSKEEHTTIKSRLAVLGGGPTQNFLVWRTKEEKIPLKIELAVPKFGKIVIRKVDEYRDSNIKLEGIEFRLYNTNKGWVAEKNGKIEFVKHFDDAKKYYTDKNGVTTADKLPLGTYMVFETGIPDGLKEFYSLSEIAVPVYGEGPQKRESKIVEYTDERGNTTDKIEVNKGQEMTITAENKRAYTDLVIKKVDKDTGKELDGIKFKVYRNNGNNSGWIQTDKNGVVLEQLTDFEHATEYVSGVTAKFERVVAGSYTAFETDLGQYADMYDLGEFTLDGKTYKGREVATKDIAPDKDREFILKISNPQTKIKISGYVWEEQLVGKNTQTKNSTYDEGVDKKVQGIEVRLLNSLGEVEQKAYTNEKGEYCFENVRIRMDVDSEIRSFLTNYRIQFVYDGILYQDVISNYDDIVHYENASKTEINKTSSKVVEDEKTRNSLNNDFKELTGKNQVLPSGTKLDYSKNGNVVTLNNMSTRTDVSDKLVKVDGKTDFPVTASTIEYQLQRYLDALDKKGDFVEEIKNINLGVYRREMPNITLQKDTYKADVSVNGYTYSYMYYPKATGNTQDTTMGVSFEKDNGEYRLPIYEADVNYDADASKALKAEVMYRISLENLTNNLSTTVNAIRESFPKDYILEKNAEIYISNNEYETIFNDNNRLSVSDIQVGKSANSEYYDGVITFKEPIKLAPLTDAQGGCRKYIYIKLKIADVKALYQLATEDAANSKKLENLAEISRYSVYEDADFTKLYAGFDYTSIPNTMDINNFEATDEDDSDKAQGLRIVDAGERSISGTVFEDNAISEGEGKERFGNGIFDDGEKTISGVKVELLDENGNIAKVYKNNQFVDAEAQNTTDGNFTISGFLPGKYKILYTWGDDNYKVVDYKGTIYVDDNRANNVNWINEKEEIRYSDAWDDYELRKAIDQKALYNTDTPGYTDLSKMKSATPDFVVGIEKENYTEVLVGDRTKYEYNIHNVDFGIIERPRQSIIIEKNLSAISVVTNDGQPIIDAKIKDGKLEVATGEKYVSSGNGMEYVWLQIDKNITQGMTAKMGYNITVRNNSEIDYDDEGYYKFGKKTENPIQMRLQAKEVYDYVKGSVLAEENTTTWETISAGNYKVDTVTGYTLTEDNFMEVYEKTVNEDNETVQTFNWNTIHKTIKEIYTEWVEDMAQTKAEHVRKVKIADRNIVKYVADQLTSPLAPGESKTAEIKTSRLLANGDDIRFDNDAEITDIVYTSEQKTGRKPSATTSILYARGGWASITPATGEDKDYTWMIVTAVSAIAVLGVGIIFIKKKILK